MVELRAADLPQEQPFVERPQSAEPPTRIASPIAHGAARAAAWATNSPADSLAALQDEYERTGNIEEYNRLAGLAAQANDIESAKRVSTAIRMSAMKHGIDASTALRTDPEVAKAIGQETEDKKLLDRNRVVSDIIKQAQSVPQEGYADAYDKQDTAASQTHESLLSLVRKSLNQGKDMHEITREVFPFLKEYSPIKNFAQSLFSSVANLNALAGVASDLDLGLGIKSLDAGSVYQAIRERAISLVPEQRVEFLDKVTKLVTDNNAFFTDTQIYQFMEELYSPEFINSTGIKGPYNDWSTTAFPVLDLTGASAVVALPLRLGTATVKMAAVPIMKTMFSANKNAAKQEILAALMSSEHVVNGKFGVSKAAIAHWDVLKVGGDSVISDVPNIAGSVEELARIEALNAKIMQQAATATSELIPASAKVSQVETKVAEVTQTSVGKLHPGKSTVTPFEDGSGYRLQTLYGKNDTTGFGRLKDAVAHAKLALKNGAGKGASIWSSDGTDITALMTLDEASEASAASLKQRGNFYVQLTDDYLFSPMDHLTSETGQATNLSLGWLGRARQYVTNPSAWFDRAAYSQYVRRFSMQSSMTSDLDAIITPLWRLKRSEKVRVNDALVWAAEFGKKENRNATIQEIQAQFGGSLSEKELRGIYTARSYFDVLYNLENSRVYSALAKKRAMTIKSVDGKTAFHGVPLDVEGAGKLTRVFDAALGKIVDITDETAKAIYKAGGRVIKTELAVSTKTSEREVVYHVLYDPSTAKKGWEFAQLSRTPLKYIHGYFPRMYEDPYVIMKTTKDMMVDGTKKADTSAAMVASSRKEALEAIERLKAAGDDPSVEYFLRSDMRMASLDETAANQQIMQMEGRLFYDDRTSHLLHAGTGELADIVAPINTIAKSARIMARQATSEDFSLYMVDSWKAGYGAMIKDAIGKEINPDLLSVEAAIRLLEQVANTPGLGKLGRDALESFRYIQMMRGATDPASALFRSKLIAAGEFLYNSNLIGKSLGKEATRSLWKFSPLQAMRELTFIDFIVFNPVKQLFLNAQQHLFLAALDPLYLGRWQVDTHALLSGVRMSKKALAGLGELREATIIRNAKLMRISREEYELLVNKFLNSGLMDNVNIRAALGDIPIEAANVPLTRGAAAASKAWGTVTARPVRRALERNGFDMGERINVTASYLPALRAIMKRDKVKKLTDLTESQWRDVAVKGSDYATAMIRPNASRYQRNLLAVPLQFLQFQHKVLLTVIGANKAFTKWESAKLIFGQFILFGGGAYGIQPEVKRALSEIGVTDPTAVDIISGGFLDWLLDKSMQAITNNPEENSNFSAYLAPLSGIRQVATTFYEIAFKNAPIKSVFGVSGHGASKLVEGALLAKEILKSPDEASWSEHKVLHALDAIAEGALSGYSTLQHALVAKKLGYWQASNGEVSSVRARIGEVVLRGLLGVNPEEFETNSTIMKGFQTHDTISKEDIMATKSDAKVYYDRIRTMVNRYGEGMYSYDYFISMVERERELIIDTRDPQMAEAFQNEFNALVANSRSQQDSLPVAMVKALKAGGTPREWMIAEIQNSSAMDQTEKAAAIKWIRDQLDDAESAIPAMYLNLNNDREGLVPD